MDKLLRTIRESNNPVVVITTRSLKKKILSKLSLDGKIYDIKFRTKLDFLCDVNGKFKAEAVDYLHLKYEMRPEFSRIVIDNLDYVELETYHNKKIDDLVKVKKELIREGYYEQNLLALNLYKNASVIVFGYEIDNVLRKSLNVVTERIIEFIEEGTNDCDLTISKYKNELDEVQGVALKIANLINRGIDINKIKLEVTDKMYLPVIDAVFNDFNIAVDTLRSKNLSDFEVTSRFIELLESKKVSLKEAISASFEEIESEPSMSNPQLRSTLSILKRAINRFLVYDGNTNEYIELIKYELRNTIVPKAKFINCVEIIDIHRESIEDDHHVFLLNFSDGFYPTIKNDNDYLSDEEKQILGIETSIEINKKNESRILHDLNKINNLYISFPQYLFNQRNVLSRLVQILELTSKVDIVEAQLYTTFGISFSQKRDQIELAKKLDMFYKYHTFDDAITVLQNSNKGIKYREYDNTFTGVNKNSFKDFCKDKLFLSYTSINEYNQCSFKYYLNRVLRINSKVRNQLSLDIGNLYHYTLEKFYSSGNFGDIDTEIKNYFDEYINLKNLEINPHFLHRYSKHLRDVVEVLVQNDSKSSFDTLGLEQELLVNKEVNGFEVTIRGFADKINKYETDNATYIVIVDYKTGKPKIDLQRVPHGLDMQLPMYLYFMREMDIVSDLKYAGIYLQPILPGIYNKEKDTPYIDIVRSYLKPKGHTNSKMGIVSKLDCGYDNESYIDKLKTKKDGTFTSNSKVLSENQFDQLIDLVSSNVDKVISNITNAKFDINPKQIGKDRNVSCNYCEFNDICFKSNKDFIELKAYKDLAFLEGIDNG